MSYDDLQGGAPSGVITPSGPTFRRLAGRARPPSYKNKIQRERGGKRWAMSQETQKIESDPIELELECLAKQRTLSIHECACLLARVPTDDWQGYYEKWHPFERLIISHLLWVPVEEDDDEVPF